MNEQATTVGINVPPPVHTVIGAMEDKKAFDIMVLDLRGAGAFTDFFIVGSGQSSRQVKAIADVIGARLKAEGQRPVHVEGYDHAEWVLMDCFDVIVHIFTREARRDYDLERLWGSATRIEVPPHRQSDRPG